MFGLRRRSRFNTTSAAAAAAAAAAHFEVQLPPSVVSAVNQRRWRPTHFDVDVVVDDDDGFVAGLLQLWKN